jgi:hypothetical protein
MGRFWATTILMLQLGLTASAASGRVELRIEVPPGGVVLGGSFTLHLAYHGPSARVEFPPSPYLGPDFRVFRKEARDHGPEETPARAYRVVPLRAGLLQVPGITVILDGGEGMRSNRAEVVVQSPRPPEDGALWEPDLIRPLPAKSSLTWILSLFVLLILGGGAAGWVCVARARKPKGGESPLPPHEIALRALAGLRGTLLVTRAQCDAFYVTFSAALKAFIQARFRVRVLDKTTDEAVRVLEAQGEADPESVRTVTRLLEHSDGVKFSPCLADRARAASDLDAAEEFVRAFSPAASKEVLIPPESEPGKEAP